MTYEYLGSCCNCGREDNTVRNIVMLDMKSPEPGIGCWGCVICNLPQAGATAVLCDACLASSNAHPQRIVLGSPANNRRMPISNLTEPFEHDMTKHEAEEAEHVPPEKLQAFRKLADQIADKMFDQLRNTLKAHEIGISGIEAMAFDNEQRINLEQIENMAGRSDVDNRTAEVLALCEIARQAGTIARELKRLGDLYQFELGVDVVEPEPDASEAIIVPQDSLDE